MAEEDLRVGHQRRWLGERQVNAYVSALCTLYREQQGTFRPSLSRPIFHPHPRQARLKSLLEEMKRGDRDRRRDCHEDRAKGRLDQGYTEDDIATFVDRLWKTGCPQMLATESGVVNGGGSGDRRQRKQRVRGSIATSGEMLRTAAVCVSNLIKLLFRIYTLKTNFNRTFFAGIMPWLEQATAMLWSWPMFSLLPSPMRVMGAQQFFLQSFFSTMEKLISLAIKSMRAFSVPRITILASLGLWPSGFSGAGVLAMRNSRRLPNLQTTTG